MNRKVGIALAASLPWMIAARAPAQEPTFMEAATHPGAGQFYGRMIVNVAEATALPHHDDARSLRFKIARGLTADTAIVLDADFLRVRMAPDAESRSGFGRVTARLKQRVFRRDLGPLDTWRASLLAGAEIPGPSDAVAPDHPAARLGAVTTAILGRHGLNGQADWTARDRDADSLSVNASHLYRVAPARYGPETTGAWYTMIESLNSIREGGSARADLALGILYEARRWAWEAAGRFPLAERDDNRAPRNRFATGIRYLF